MCVWCGVGVCGVCVCACVRARARVCVCVHSAGIVTGTWPPALMLQALLTEVLIQCACVSRLMNTTSVSKIVTSNFLKVT
jgi:hypothetical protein